jgi:hypothetical protein
MLEKVIMINRHYYSYNTFPFHLEENVGAHGEAKATGGYQKAFDKDEKMSTMVDEPQSPTEENQAQEKKRTRCVYKKILQIKSHFFFFYQSTSPSFSTE